MTIVPKLERKEWHEKALDGAATGAELGSLPELFTATNETERLAKLVRGSSHEALKNVSRSFTEPAAKRLEKDHPACRLPVVRTRNSQRMEAHAGFCRCPRNAHRGRKAEQIL